MSSCKSKNARGEPCGAHAHLIDQGTGLCPAHAPGGREEMRRRGLRGGRATKEAWKRPGVGADELGALETVADAQRWLRVLGCAVVGGRLDKGDATAATRAIEVWLKADDSLTEADMERLAEKISVIQGGKPKLRRLPA